MYDFLGQPGGHSLLFPVRRPRGVSSRFVASVWALFAVVFTASYTANLAAFMITKQDYDRITGVNDPLVKHPCARQQRN